MNGRGDGCRVDRTARAGRLIVAAACIAALLAPALASAQTASEATLKAAFLLNFARFTDWPEAALPPGAPLSICVAGDPAVADALAALAGEKTVAGRSLAVRVVISTVSLPSCHILYVTAGHDEDAALRAALARPAVLSVSDEKSFTRAGGIIELVVENSRMRFAVNVDAARRTGLLLSSKLLNLATIVRETSDAR